MIEFQDVVDDETRNTRRDSSQVLMLTLQMQALALAVEDIRSRIQRIERHLKLDPDAETTRSDRGKLEHIW